MAEPWPRVAGPWVPSPATTPLNTSQHSGTLMLCTAWRTRVSGPDTAGRRPPEGCDLPAPAPQPTAGSCSGSCSRAPQGGAHRPQGEPGPELTGGETDSGDTDGNRGSPAAGAERGAPAEVLGHTAPGPVSPSSACWHFSLGCQRGAARGPGTLSTSMCQVQEGLDPTSVFIDLAAGMERGTLHPSLIPALPAFYFETGSCYLPRLAWTWDPPASAFSGAGITGVHHTLQF